MRVALVAGGPSSEAEVSRASARGVAQALQTAGHDVHVFELMDSLPIELAGYKPEVVFPVTHGALGEDGCLQGLLEVLDLPYVGSGVLASALAADKTAAKAAFSAHGLPLATSTSLRHLPAEAELPDELVRLRAMLGAAFVVKPAGGGSAIGVSVLGEEAGPDDLAAALRTVFDMDAVALVETFWRGNEVTCGVLEDAAGDPKALPPTLIRARAAGWYDFKSKYGSGGSEHVCPAPFDDALKRRLQQTAVAAHRALGARDLSRTDFIVREDGEFIVLELNSLPGMTKTSLFPEAAAVSGIPFPALCDRLVRKAAARPRRRALRGVPLPE
jgi:D-alanine-D-alanine ligase